MRSPHCITRAVGVTVAVLVASGVVAGAAAAGPATVTHFHHEDTIIHPANSKFCALDFEVEEVIDVSGTFVGVHKGLDGTFYGATRMRGSVVYTNTDNENSIVNTFAINDKDQRVTEHADGSVTILVLATGNETYKLSGTKLVLRNPGQVRIAIHIDAEGNASFDVVRESTGRNDTAGRNFCDDLATFLGG